MAEAAWGTPSTTLREKALMQLTAVNAATSPLPPDVYKRQLYLYALFSKRCRHVLVLGGLAHVVIFLAYLISFFQFPAGHHGFSGRLDASQPSFWVSCILLAAHLVLFFTTEAAAMRRLNKRRTA